MDTTLKRQYLAMMIPAVCLCLSFSLARQLNFVQPGQFAIASALQSMVFFLSAITALAGPLLLRTFFAHSLKGKKQVASKTFLSFQQRILWISQITPYLFCIAYFCDFPRFYAGSILLMAMYAAYYYFPSQKRIHFDLKIFRVK